MESKGNKMLNTGNPAPDFTLMTNGGDEITLSSLRGKKVVLYFYPKDDTSGCTAQACDFRDTLPDFSALDALILGVSRDPIKSHDRFKEKYSLNFPLLSDESGDVCQLYGVWVEKSMYGKKYFGIERSTFLIDERGIITHIWRKVKVPGHISEIIEKLSKD